MKNILLKTIGMTLLLLGTTMAMANVTVMGTVVDANGDPVIGANIMVKGSTTGTITDFDGNYSLDVADGASVLVFSYIGMQPQEMSATQAVGKTITLREDAEVLEEVVVVGFGTQKKESLTGSVAVVGADKFENLGAVSSPLQALQGAVPGAIITRSSSAPGDESWNINLRGQVSMNSTEPLLIIDGVAANSVSEMKNINEADIESINFLKDGSAAIYGSRAAGGVILITTKQGKAGKVKVEYNGSATVKMVGLQPTLMNIDQFADGLMQALENDGNTSSVWYTYAQLMKQYKGSYIDLSKQANPFGSSAFTDVADFTFSNTDWLGSLFGTTTSTAHNLSVSGGNEKNSFRLSMAYTYDGSVLQYGKNNNQKFNIRLNDVQHFTKNISLTSNINYSRQDQVAPSQISQALTTNLPQPGLPLVGESGTNYGWGTWGSPVGKVVDGGDNKLCVNNFGINETFDWKILPEWLSLNVNLGFTHNEAQRNTVTNPVAFYNYTGTIQTLNNPVQEKSSYNQTQSRTDFLSATGYMNFHHGWVGHNVSATLGGQYEYKHYNYFGVKAENIQKGLEIVNGSGDVTISQQQLYEYAIGSAFGRFNYDYKGRYLVEGSIRVDGSSKFLPKNRWACFGGVSVGWRMSEEEWLKADWLTNLKLRYSYAQVGNQSGIGYYDGVQLYELKSNAGAYVGDGLLSYIATNGTFASTSRTWERISNYNAAIDFGFLLAKGHQLNGTVEVFHKQNNNMLVNIKLPATLGDNPPSSNAGKFRDYGAEGQLTYTGRVGKWEWNIGGTFTWARNELVEYQGTSVRNSGYTSTQVGYGLNSLFGLRYGGKIQNEEQLAAYMNLYQSTNSIGMPAKLRVGDNMYCDENGDGHLTEEDYIYLGSSDPEMSYSFNAGFNWNKTVDFAITFQGAANRFIYRGNTNNWVVPFRALYQSVTTASIGNVWSENNRDAYYAPYTNSSDINLYNYQASTLTAQDGRYLRLKNVTLGLTFPKRWLGEQKAVTNVRFYVCGSDLWEATLITDGWDPESKISTSGTALYPFTRNVSFGFNLTFN